MSPVRTLARKTLRAIHIGIVEIQIRILAVIFAKETMNVGHEMDIRVIEDLITVRLVYDLDINVDQILFPCHRRILVIYKPYYQTELLRHNKY